MKFSRPRLRFITNTARNWERNSQFPTISYNTNAVPNEIADNFTVYLQRSEVTVACARDMIAKIARDTQYTSAILAIMHTAVYAFGCTFNVKGNRLILHLICPA
jgi:hypothetical protein